MTLTVVIRVMLLILLIVCALAVNINQNLLQAVIIFMSYSSIMCIVWIFLESPDLAITEAAVGAGISGVLFLLTLKRINAADTEEIQDEDMEMFQTDVSESTPVKSAAAAAEQGAAQTKTQEMFGHETE